MGSKCCKENNDVSQASSQANSPGPLPTVHLSTRCQNCVGTDEKAFQSFTIEVTGNNPTSLADDGLWKAISEMTSRCLFSLVESSVAQGDGCRGGDVEEQGSSGLGWGPFVVRGGQTDDGKRGGFPTLR